LDAQVLQTAEAPALELGEGEAAGAAADEGGLLEEDAGGTVGLIPLCLFKGGEEV
jgi:hypothetical protein